MSFTVREVGPAESHADSYLVLPANEGAAIAFTGDLAFHGTHPYTADGHSGAWLAALDVLGGELPGIGTLYPGHGDPASRACSLTSGVTCCTTASSSEGYPGVSRSYPRQRSPSCGTALQAFLPDAPLTWMIELGADAVAAELAPSFADART